MFQNIDDRTCPYRSDDSCAGRWTGPEIDSVSRFKPLRRKRCLRQANNQENNCYRTYNLLKIKAHETLSSQNARLFFTFTTARRIFCSSVQAIRNVVIVTDNGYIVNTGATVVYCLLCRWLHFTPRRKRAGCVL